MVKREPGALAARLAASLDRSLERSVSGQLADLVWREIIDGTLDVGERLPTVRELSIELRVHPRVVERAVGDLEQRGVVRVEPGGMFVCLGEVGPDERGETLDALCVELAAKAEARGFGLDELIEGLADLRLERRSRRGP